MSGGSARATLSLPSISHVPQNFDVEYEWDDQPSQGNGWDDPGDGGVFYLTTIEWITDTYPIFSSVEVPRGAWDAIIGDGKTLHETLCEAINDEWSDWDE